MVSGDEEVGAAVSGSGVGVAGAASLASELRTGLSRATGLRRVTNC